MKSTNNKQKKCTVLVFLAEDKLATHIDQREQLRNFRFRSKLMKSTCKSIFPKSIPPHLNSFELYGIPEYLQARFISYVKHLWSQTEWPSVCACQCTEVHFVSFLFGRFTTMAVINPPERKLANRTSVQWLKIDQATETDAEKKVFY